MLSNRPTLQSHPNLSNIRLLDSLPMLMLRRMMRTGIAIDLPKLAGLSAQMGERMRELEAEVRKHVPTEKWNEFVGKDPDAEESSDLVAEEKPRELPQINVNSAEQMAWFLFDVLGLGAGKNLKRTADGHRISTGKKQLELLKEEHGVIQLLLEYRENHKLKTTYADALPKRARLHPKGKCPICSSIGDPVYHLDSHYRIHTTFTSTRTETGRYASKAPNLQNIPARSELGEQIRSAFIASPGYKLVGADHSQIELRTLAHCSGDRLMRRIFREGGDIHDRTTAGIFKLQKVDKKEKVVVAADGSLIDWHHYSARMRAPMKNINFGICYGLTPIGLQAQLALSGIYLSEEECAQLIAQWFGFYTSVEPYMNEQHYRARHYGMVWDMWGRVRYCSGVYSVHRRVQQEALREAGNQPIQAGATGLMKLAMWDMWCRDLEAFRGEVPVNPLLTVHDELIEETEEWMADDLLDLNVGVMCGVAELAVPIGAAGNAMACWEK